LKRKLLANYCFLEEPMATLGSSEALRTGSGRSRPPEPGAEWAEVTEAFFAATQCLAPDEMVFTGKSFRWASCISAVELTSPNLDSGASLPLGKTYLDSVQEGIVPDSIDELFCTEVWKDTPALSLIKTSLSTAINWADGRCSLPELMLPNLYIFKALFREEHPGTAFTSFLNECCIFFVRHIRALILHTNVHFEEDISVKMQLPFKLVRKISGNVPVFDSESTSKAIGQNVCPFLRDQAVREVAEAAGSVGLDPRLQAQLIAHIDIWWHLCILASSTGQTLSDLNSQAHILQRLLSDLSVVAFHEEQDESTLGFDAAVVRHLLPPSPPMRMPRMKHKDALASIDDFAAFCIRLDRASRFLRGKLAPPPFPSLERCTVACFDLACICVELHGRERLAGVSRACLCKEMISVARSFVHAYDQKTEGPHRTFDAERSTAIADASIEAEQLLPIIEVLIHVLCMNSGRQRRRLLRVLRKIGRDNGTRQAVLAALNSATGRGLRCRAFSKAVETLRGIDMGRAALALWIVLRIIDLGFDLELYSAIELRYLQALELLLLRSIDSILSFWYDPNEEHVSLHLLRARLVLSRREYVRDVEVQDSARNVSENSCPRCSIQENVDGATHKSALIHGACSENELPPKEELSESEQAAFALRFRSLFDFVPISPGHVNSMLRGRYTLLREARHDADLAALESFKAAVQSLLTDVLKPTGNAPVGSVHHVLHRLRAVYGSCACLCEA
jgi:hypothetical protein